MAQQIASERTTSERANPEPGGWAKAVACFGLVVSVFLVYGRALSHEFVDWDDPQYLVENPQVTEGLSLESISWALTANYAANWHPLTWMSHMVDCELFGLEAGGHHAVSVVLHALNAVLLFLALRGMTGAFGPALFVAFLFALHPLRVESVAWASERKDVLSGFFWMLCLWFYAGYAARRRRRDFFAVAVCLGLGLMSKPMLVTLPFVLLLLDVWPLGRRERGESWGRLVLEKAPLFGLVVASSLLTLIAQKKGGAVVPLLAVPLEERVGNALVSYGAYLGKTIWPTKLAFYYPHPSLAGSSSLLFPAVLSAGLLLVLSGLAFWVRRSRPYVVVGWLWYLGTLVPVIGILQVGGQSFADRYTYLPSIGIGLALGWAGKELFSPRVEGAVERGVGAKILSIAGALGILVLAGVSLVQVGTWKNSQSLFEQALRVTRNNDVAHQKLAIDLDRRNKPEEAISHYRMAVEINPEYAEAHYNLAVMLTRRGDAQEARHHYSEALRVFPGYAKARYGLGLLSLDGGDLDSALREFEESLRLDPELVDAYNNRGVVYARQGRFRAAIAEFEAVLEIDPENLEAKANLRIARKKVGQERTGG